MIIKALSKLFEFLSSQRLYAILVLFIWIPRLVCDIASDKGKDCIADEIIFLLIWSAVILIIYPFLWGLIGILLDKLQKEE